MGEDSPRPYGISCQQISFTHSFIHYPLVHSHSLAHIHSCTYSLIHHALVHPHSFTRSLSFTSTRALTHSFIHHPLVHSSTTCSFILIHSLTHPSPSRSSSFTHSFSSTHALTHSSIQHPLVHSHPLTLSLTHSLNSFPTHSLSLMHSFIFTHSHSLSLTHSTGYLKCRLCPALRPMHESPLLSHLEPWETNIRAGHD